MYIGNDLQIAHPSYRIIDDISSGFNGSTTSFALQVSGATPVPFPISTQQVMISVNGVVQEPDPTGSAGFKLLGSNIVFSSAPANGHAFFGVINAGADYVTAGSEFPDGSATAPSFTFQDDQDTGWFRSGSGAVGYSANGAQTLTFDGNGLTVTGDASFVGDSSKNLLWDKSDGQLEFADNAKAIFGTGADLQIFHDGSVSKITNSTGNFIIEASASGVIALKPHTNENGIITRANGASELYHDNSKKFETISEGAKVTGRFEAVVGGNFEVLRVERTGTANGKFGFKLNNDSGNDCGLLLRDEKADATRLTITSAGNLKIPDSKEFQFGTGSDLKIFHDGSNSYIDDSGTGNLVIRSNQINFDKYTGESLARFRADGNCELFYDNVSKFKTDADGFQLTGQASCYLDLNTYESSTSTLRGALHANNSNQVGLVDSQLHWLIKGIKDGAVELYHDNSKKLETTSSGVTVSGNADVTGTVIDSKGDVRKIPGVSKSSAHTLIATDAGKAIYISSGGVTVPNSVFGAGDAVTIVNDSGSDQTITQGSGFSLFNSADASTGNRTLAGRGMATIWFSSASGGYISGAGLS